MFKINKNRNIIILLIFLSVILTPIISNSEIIFEVEDFFADNDDSNLYYFEKPRPVESSASITIISINYYSSFDKYPTGGNDYYCNIIIPGAEVKKVLEIEGNSKYLVISSDKGLFLLNKNDIYKDEIMLYYKLSKGKSLNKIIKVIDDGCCLDVGNYRDEKRDSYIIYSSDKKIKKFKVKENLNNENIISLVFEGKKPIYCFNIIYDKIFISYYPKGFEVREINRSDFSIGKRLYYNKNIFINKVYSQNGKYRLESDNKNYYYLLNLKKTFKKIQKNKKEKVKNPIKLTGINQVFKKISFPDAPYGDLCSFIYNEQAYLGTWGNGIFVVENLFQSWDQFHNPIKDEVISGLVKYKDKIIYSTWDGWIGFLESNQPPIQLMENIYHLKLGHNDNLYICGKGSIKIVNLKNTKFNNSEFKDGTELKIPEKLKDTEFLSLGEYYSEEGYLHIFAGTFQNGLLHTVITHNNKYQYHVLKGESIPIIEDSYNKIFISTGEKVYYFDEIFKRLDIPDNGKVTDIKYISGDFKRVLGKEMNEFKGDEEKYLVISTEKMGITIYDLNSDERLTLPIYAKKLAIEKLENRKSLENWDYIRQKPKPKQKVPDKPLFKIIAAEEFANEIRIWKIGIY